MSELKECPFCGSRATDPEKTNTSGRNVWETKCVHFCIYMRRSSKKELVRDWNRRTLMSSPAGEGEPVGVVREFHVDWHKQAPPQGTQLYTAPQAHPLGPSLLEQSDLEFIAARLARVAKRVGYPMPDGDAQFLVSVSGSILGAIDRIIEGSTKGMDPPADVLRDAELFRFMLSKMQMPDPKDFISYLTTEMENEAAMGK